MRALRRELSFEDRDKAVLALACVADQIPFGKILGRSL